MLAKPCRHDSSQAVGPQLQDGDTLPTQVHRYQPGRPAGVHSESGRAAENAPTVLSLFAESGKGSLGKLISVLCSDPLSDTVAEFQKIVAQIGNGEGSLGRLISRNDAYDEFIATLDKMDKVVDDVQQGKGTAGKFV